MYKFVSMVRLLPAFALLALGSGAAWAQSSDVILDDFEGSTVPKNKGNEGS